MFFVIRVPSFSQSYDIKIKFKVSDEILKVVSIVLKRTDVTVEKTKGRRIVFIFEHMKFMGFIIFKIRFEAVVCIKGVIKVIGIVVRIPIGQNKFI